MKKSTCDNSHFRKYCDIIITISDVINLCGMIRSKLIGIAYVIQLLGSYSFIEGYSTNIPPVPLLALQWSLHLTRRVR